MKKNLVLLTIVLLLALSGCFKDIKDTTLEEQKSEVTAVENPYIPSEDKEAMRTIQDEIAREYPLTEIQNDLNFKRATNPSNSEIVAAMKAAGIKYNVPFEVLYGIGMCESNLTQYKSNGQPLISGDEGYGIMQVTPWAISEKFDVESLKWNYKYNIEAGAQVILGKWKYVNGRNPIGNCDPKVLENWYITIWAYNGYSTINNPNEYKNGPRTWNNGYITWTRTSPYQTEVLNAIYKKFGTKITAIPASQLPATGIPASGKAFSTPQPMHYTGGTTAPITKGTVTVNVADALKTNETITISGTASQGVETIVGYIDGTEFASGEVAVVNGKYSFTCLLTKTGTRTIKIVGTGTAEATVEKVVTVTSGTAAADKITVDIADTLSTNTTYTISGTATAGITKINGYIDNTLFLNGGNVSVVNGKYSFTMALSKAGNRVIKIVGTGSSTVTATKNVVVKDVEKIEINCPSEMETNTTYTISGTATSGITKISGYIDDTLFLNGGNVSVVNGKYSFTMALSKAGNRVIKIVGSGNTTVTATKNVVVKDGAKIEINCPSEMTTNTTYTISGTATAGITKINGYIDDTLFLNGGNVSVVNGKYSFTMALSKAGNRVIKIVGTGSSTVTATKNVVVREAAKIEINCASEMTVNTTYTISGTVSAGITKINGYIDDTLFLNGGNVSVVNGKYSFTMALSKSGNRVIKIVGTGSSTVTATKNVVVKGETGTTGQRYGAYYTNNYSAIIAETKKFWSQSYGCAATCSTSLKMFGFNVRQVLLTNDVESQLIKLGWKKITNLSTLVSGDVVFTDKAVSNVAGTYSHVYVFIQYNGYPNVLVNDNQGRLYQRSLNGGEYSKSVVAYRAP